MCTMQVFGHLNSFEIEPKVSKEQYLGRIMSSRTEPGLCVYGDTNVFANNVIYLVAILC